MWMSLGNMDIIVNQTVGFGLPRLATQIKVDQNCERDISTGVTYLEGFYNDPIY